ncbi:MAG TPA: glycerophosphodiester phosphodiesterase family protein [Steroidobacteraceae bacterium]|nr:glycerophosphodiester phosphodiesterase family protein [Steroidobacteraceae bacterium]
MNQPRLIHLVAHRGNARECPENTLPAFQSALELGARFLELDVHLSSDEIPIVIHDSSLARTAGVPGSVFEMTAAELQQIEVAERNRFGDRYSGTRLLTLADMLRALLEGRPEVTVFVEIKRGSLRHFGHDQVVASVVEAIRPWRSQCVAISFDLAAVHQMRLACGVKIGWVLGTYDEHSRLKYEALQPEFLICDHEQLPARGALWRGPWRWVIYEVEALALAVDLAERGADYIETMAVRELSAAMRGR